MKVCALIPVYMSEDSRIINKENLQKLKDTEFKFVDEVVICDQCFEKEDYVDGFTYLGPFQQFKYKVADARNCLFEWFYASDYDYAVLLDARESLTKSGLNSFVTLMDAIHSNNLHMDFIQGTMGMIANTQRVADKCRNDYKEIVYVRKMTTIQPHLHHTIISNFNKKYGIKLFLPADKMGAASGVQGGIPDDIYFAKLCQTYFDTFLVGELCVNTGKQTASTWAKDTAQEKHESDSNYYARSNALIRELGYNPSWDKHNYYQDKQFKRSAMYIDLLGEYKPKSKKVVENNTKVLYNKKVELF